MMKSPLNIPPSYHEKVTITQLDPMKTSQYQVEFEVSSVVYPSPTKLILANPHDLPFLSFLHQNRNITSISFSSSEFSDLKTPYFLSKNKSIVSFPTGLSIQLTTTSSSSSSNNNNNKTATSSKSSSNHKESDIPLSNIYFLRPLLESSHLLFPWGVSARSDFMRFVEQQYPTHVYHTTEDDSNQQYHHLLWNSPHPSLTYGLLYSSFLYQMKKEFTYPCAYYKEMKNGGDSYRNKLGILSTLFDTWEPQVPSSSVQITHRASYLHVSTVEEEEVVEEEKDVEEEDSNETLNLTLDSTKKIHIKRILRYTLSLLDDPPSTTTTTTNTNSKTKTIQTITLQSLFQSREKYIQQSDDMIMLRECPMMDTSELNIQYFDTLEQDFHQIGSDSSSMKHDDDDDENNECSIQDDISTCSSSTTTTTTANQHNNKHMGNIHKMKSATVNLKLHPISLNLTLADIIHIHKSSESTIENDTNTQYIAPSMIRIQRTVKRPHGIWNSGILETFVSNCGPDTNVLNPTTLSTNISPPTTNITLVDIYPNIIRPIWYTLGIFLIQDDIYDTGRCTSSPRSIPSPKSHNNKHWKQQLHLSDFSSNEAQLNLNEDGSSSISLNIIFHPHTTLYISLEYHPQFLSLDQFPADPNRGFDISPSYCMIHHPFPSSYRIYSNTLLLMPPVPDMSMPYNVITITNSFMALIVGVVTNILVKKATKQIKDALKDKDARKERISVVGKLWRKVRAMK